MLVSGLGREGFYLVFACGDLARVEAEVYLLVLYSGRVSLRIRVMGGQHGEDGNKSMVCSIDKHSESMVLL